MNYRQPIASRSKNDGPPSSNRIHSDYVPLYQPTPLVILEGNKATEQEKEENSSLSARSDVKTDDNHALTAINQHQISRSTKTRERVPETSATLDSSSEGRVSASYHLVILVNVVAPTYYQLEL